MALQILFAIVAGILTIGAPCILPMLPIILATSINQTAKKRPIFITLGFIISFAAVALLFNQFSRILGLSANSLRNIAVVLLLIFGILMLWPLPFEKLTQFLGKYINKAGQVSGGGNSGNWGGFLLGLMLGILWTPCAGPVLGTILTLIATKQNFGQAAILLVSYALGSGIPMLAIAYGGQYATSKVRSITKYARPIQQVFGVIIILLAIAINFQYDTLISSKLTKYSIGINLAFPNSSSTPSQKASSTALSDYGPAPQFTGITDWLNSGPQTIAGLKGKVVLVDFWTYSCINCVRTLPYLTGWYNEYKNQGLVIIGVHTPEFPFEQVTSNVSAAIKQYGITYPVAQDNNYATWNAYHNDSWPAEYLINQNGEIVYEHFGEGNYQLTENAIRQLLGLSSLSGTSFPTPNFSAIGTPETYLGLEREDALIGSENPNQNVQSFQLPTELPQNNYAVSGNWKFNQDSAELPNGPGQIEINFDASKAYIVAQSAKPLKVNVLIDGKQVNQVTIQASQLYDLYSSSTYARHTLELQIPAGADFQAYTFTFG